MDGFKMNFFLRVYYSITSFEKYRYFLRLSTGKAILYLLLFTLVVGMVTFIPIITEFNIYIDEFTEVFDTELPDFKLENGKLEVSGAMPVILESEGIPIVIDTSPDAEERILAQYDTVLLITSDKIIQKYYINKSVTNFSNFPGLVLTKDMLEQALPLVRPVSIIIFIFAGIFFILGKFITALIVSLIGMILNSSMRLNLSYRSIFKISVYAMTLPLIVCTVLDKVPVFIPFKWVIFYAIAFVYVYGAMNSIKKEIDKINKSNISDVM